MHMYMKQAPVRSFDDELRENRKNVLKDVRLIERLWFQLRENFLQHPCTGKAYGSNVKRQRGLPQYVPVHARGPHTQSPTARRGVSPLCIFPSDLAGAFSFCRNSGELLAQQPSVAPS